MVLDVKQHRIGVHSRSEADECVSFVTVTEPTLDADTCRWCGGALIQAETGRPRLYCRDSHRQRAYEARRLGWRMGLDSGEAIVSASALDDLGDRLTVLEAALDDVEGDLKVETGREAYQEAFRHLYAAAAAMRGSRLRARALVRQP